MTWPNHADHLRIGTAERDRGLTALGEHLGAGRLDVVEYEQRVSRVAAAQTVGELLAVFADLPAPHPIVDPHSFGPMPQYVPNMPAYPQAELSDKSKVVAGVLQIIPGFGIGRFYLGHIGIGVAQLLVALFTFGLGGIWSLIDGILILVNGGTDAHGRRLRD
jgi:TM2 domain-containing membrane protein YozV